MSYIDRLIKNALDNNKNLENNVIGKYRISPQHGPNVIVYHIYRDECFQATIRIFNTNSIDIHFKDGVNSKVLIDIVWSLKGLFPEAKIASKSFDNEI